MEQTYFEILLEEMNSGVKLLLESLSALEVKYEKKFDQLIQKIDQVGFKVDVVNNRLNEINAELSNKIDCIATDLSAHRTATDARVKYVQH